MKVTHQGREGYVMMQFQGRTRPSLMRKERFLGLYSNPIWKPMRVMKMKEGEYVATEKTLFFDSEFSPMTAAPPKEVFIESLSWGNE